MNMDVGGNACSSSSADVCADVEAIGVINFAQYAHRAADQLNHFLAGLAVQVFQGRPVHFRNDHEMAGGIGETVEDYEGMGGSVHNQVFHPIFLLNSPAKHTAIWLFLLLNVSHSPGRPELIHNVCILPDNLKAHKKTCIRFENMI